VEVVVGEGGLHAVGAGDLRQVAELVVDVAGGPAQGSVWRACGRAVPLVGGGGAKGIDDALDLEQVVGAVGGGMAEGVHLDGDPLLLVIGEGAVQASVGALAGHTAVEVVVGVAVGDGVAVGPPAMRRLLCSRSAGAAGVVDDADEVAGIVVGVPGENESGCPGGMRRRIPVIRPWSVSTSRRQPAEWRIAVSCRSASWSRSMRWRCGQ